MSRSLTAVRRSARSLVVLVATVSAVAASALANADGIDISHWQGTVNWTKVKADDVGFAFMKATEGTSYADPTLRTNWDGAERVGIHRAAYHFARPGASSAGAQAQFFVSRAGTFQDRGDLPPVLDLETTGGLSPAALRSWVATWLTTVERLTGRTPILYFSPYFWIDHMGNSTAFTRYPLWIAHYTANRPLVPGGWPAWTFWQRTSSGRVDGISGLVDMNRFNGSTAQLATLANRTGGSTAPAPTGPTLPAAAATALTVTPAKTAVAIGGTVSFTGGLTTRTPVAAVSNRAVSLWARSTGSSTWMKAATVLTDGAGHYRLTASVRRTTDYQARSTATAAYAPSLSRTVRVTTPPRALVSLGLRKNKATVAKGAALSLYGHLRAGSAGLAGRQVRYYKRSPSGGPWIYVGSSQTLAPTGWHSRTVRPEVARIWKAVYPGGDRYLPRTSTYVTVRVR